MILPFKGFFIARELRPCAIKTFRKERTAAKRKTSLKRLPQAENPVGRILIKLYIQGESNWTAVIFPR